LIYNIVLINFKFITKLKELITKTNTEIKKKKQVKEYLAKSEKCNSFSILS